MFTIFLCFLAGVLTLLCLISIYNYFTFAKVKRVLDTHSLLPFVSILVPARNEERCIRECIESLANQIYPNYEIIILDDDSSDDTPRILDELQSLYPQLISVIHSHELPDSWIGKSHACHVLSRYAKGDYLLFTDADTVHSPYALNSLVQGAQEKQVDLLSAIPYQTLTSIWEHLMVPFMHVLYHGYLPNSFIYTKKKSSFIAANGQIMLFHADAYDAIGGHESVKNSMVEDIDIARNIKESGAKVVLANATSLVSCSMYTGFEDVFKGFSKNFFAGFQRKYIPFVIFLIHIMNVYVFPVILLIISLITENATLLIWSIVLLMQGMLIRLLSTIQFRLPLFHIILQPFSALFAIIIGCNSLLWSMPGKSTVWKNRVYH